MKRLYTGERVLTESDWNRLGWITFELIIAAGIAGFLIGFVLGSGLPDRPRLWGPI